MKDKKEIPEIVIEYVANWIAKHEKEEYSHVNYILKEKGNIEGRFFMLALILGDIITDYEESLVKLKK